MKQASQQAGRLSLNNTKRAKAPASVLVETLESRQLLSGNVLASVTADGILRIRGDAAASVIALDQSGLDAGQVRISGTSNTSINGQNDAVVLSGITSRVSIRMGAGADEVSLTNIILPGGVVAEQRILTLTNVRVTGDVDVFSKSATTVIRSTIGGNLTVTSISAAGTGNVDLRKTTVQGTTTINGGFGSDYIAIDNSNFHGAFAVYAGLGKDSVRIEQRGNPLATRTKFDAPITILMGKGADTLQIGVAGQNGRRAVFAGAVLFDGKAGVDTFYSAGNQVFQQPLQVVEVNFEAHPAPPVLIDGIKLIKPAPLWMPHEAVGLDLELLKRLQAEIFLHTQHASPGNQLSVTDHAPAPVATPNTTTIHGGSVCTSGTLTMYTGSVMINGGTFSVPIA